MHLYPGIQARSMFALDGSERPTQTSEKPDIRQHSLEHVGDCEPSGRNEFHVPRWTSDEGVATPRKHLSVRGHAPNVSGLCPSQVKVSTTARIAKRVEDVVLALLLLIATAPFMLLVSLAIKL